MNWKIRELLFGNSKRINWRISGEWLFVSFVYVAGGARLCPPISHHLCASSYSSWSSSAAPVAYSLSLYYNLPSRLCYVLVAWTQPCQDVVVIAFEGERCGQSGMLLSASAACRAGNESLGVDSWPLSFFTRPVRHTCVLSTLDTSSQHGAIRYTQKLFRHFPLLLKVTKIISWPDWATLAKFSDSRTAIYYLVLCFNVNSVFSYFTRQQHR